MSTVLTDDQQRAYDAMTSYKNVCITGPAGVGKTLLINHFITNHCGSNFNLTFSTGNIAVTAATGIAATLINGNTLHSWAGIGLGNEKDLVAKIKRSRGAVARWMGVKTLIIDEISMISGTLFTKLDEIGKALRGIDSLFGGIQVIVFGDFCQLPPVRGSNDFAFQSPSWDFEVIHLTKVMRQSDLEFVAILNKIRFAEELSVEQKKLLESCMNRDRTPPIEGIKPTIIDPYRANVEQYNIDELKLLIAKNREEMAKYSADSITDANYDTHPLNQLDTILFKAVYEVRKSLGLSSSNDLDKKDNFLEKLIFDRVPCQQKLYLTTGAQVMLVRNLDVMSGLVNGARGVIRQILYRNKCPAGAMVEFISKKGILVPITSFTWSIKLGETIYEICQLPLILAWSCTSHKSQGSTIDYAEVNLADTFEYGQVYTIISRVKSLNGLIINSLDYDKIKVHSEVKKFYKSCL